MHGATIKIVKKTQFILPYSSIATSISPEQNECDFILMQFFDVAFLRCHQEFDCKCDESFLYPIYGARTQALQ